MTDPSESPVPSDTEKALLVKVYSRSLEYASRLLSRSKLPYDAGDLANGAIIALLTRWAQLRKKEGFPAFLEPYALVVVRNAHRRLFSLGSSIALDPETLISGIASDSTLDATIESEEQKRVQQLLVKLRPAETEILTWLGEGRTLEEYAKAHRTTLGAARQRLLRAAKSASELSKKQLDEG